MWAQVIYMIDNEKVIVPLTHFKDYETVESELLENKIREKYLVFWSPQDNDSPERLLKREKKILVQDKVLQGSVSAMPRKKGPGNPQAGWYSATIKQWEGKVKIYFIGFL